MAHVSEYFHAIQVKGPPDVPVPLRGWRVLTPRFSWLPGLCSARSAADRAHLSGHHRGILSIVSFIIAFEIIGLNMWASVDWNPVEFVRQLPWLALEPPPAEYGLSLPPLNEGRLVAGRRLLPDRLHHPLVGAMYPRARALGMGTHVAWAFASAIWLYLVLGLHPARC
jgi:photosynthetic reaction center M subunit